MSSRWRGAAVNALLLIGSMALFFGAAEIALRLSGRISSNALRSPDLKTLAGQPGLFEPGQDFVDRILPDLPFHVTTNSLGFRGPEIERRRPAGVVRILCLGDSYTFGPYVGDGETLPAQLERALSGGTAGRVEVVNGGVNGFTLADELQFIRERAMGIEPSLVLVFFSQNDIQDLARPRLMIDLMREHAALKSTFLVGPVLKRLQHTAVFNFMQRTAARLRGGGRKAAAAEPGEGTAGDDREEAWSRYASLLKDLSLEAKQRGLPVMLVAWPSARQIAGEESLDPQARLRALAEGSDVPFLDLTPVIQTLQASGERSFLVPLDGHPTALSYRKGAEAVARAVVERRLAGGPGSS